MPPKKQQQDLSSTSYIPITVLPIFGCPRVGKAYQCLRNKQVTIKKAITMEKISEILSAKGLDSHKNAENQQYSEEGHKIIAQNLNFVYQQYCNTVRKPPVQNKKDVKKDAKKDAKKQQVQQDETQKPLQFNFQKQCSDFYFFLDFPDDQLKLSECLNSNIKIDIVLLVRQKILSSSKKPKYELLNQFRDLNSFMKDMNEQNIQQISQKHIQQDQRKKNGIRSRKMLKTFKQFRNSRPSTYGDTVIIDIFYQKDLQQPQKDDQIFLEALFNKLCLISVQKNRYIQWRNKAIATPMIEPIRQTIKKQIQTEAKQQKKGGKKDSKPTQTKTQLIQQIVETKYESLPQNRISDLKIYKKVDELSKQRNNQSCFKIILNNLCAAITQKTGEKEVASQNNVEELASILYQKNSAKIVHKVTSRNLQELLPQIASPAHCQMGYQVQMNYQKIGQQVSLKEVSFEINQKFQAIRTQYLIQQIQNIVNKQDPHLKINFKDKEYLQKMTKKQIWENINQYLLKDPKIYKGILQKDRIKLIALAEINPPGRVLYNTKKFLNKVIPSFEHWHGQFPKQSETQSAYPSFYDYPYQIAGNLKFLTKNMMPTDNSIIQEQIVEVGDKQQNLIKVSIANNSAYMGVKKVKLQQGQGNCFWLSNKQQKNSVILKPYLRNVIKKTITQMQIQQEGKLTVVQQKQIKQQKLFCTQTWIRQQEKYTISMNPYPTIYYSTFQTGKDVFQTRRTISCKGSITRYINNGNIIIYHSNGDTAKYQNSSWEKVVDNVLTDKNGNRRQLRVNKIFQGQKIITIRQDQIVFVEQLGKQKKIVFPDGTQVINTEKPKRIIIKNSEDIIIRITLKPQSMLSQNVIGYGSAFAYLGFNNLLERSSNGYLFEVFTSTFSTHLYLEKYQHNKMVFEQETMLISFQDALMKVKNSGEAVYIPKRETFGRGKGTRRVQSSQQVENQRWLQLFTTVGNHKQGVYDIDIKQGSIISKDAESNYFKVTVNQPSQVKIAVSFKIDQESDASSNQQNGNGFHIPQLNYFLPVPSNSRPIRLFSLNDELEEYFQYLSLEQIPEFNGYQMNNHQNFYGLSHQYKRSRSSPLITFSQPISQHYFQLPEVLKSKITVLNLTLAQYDTIFYRAVNYVNWNKNFSRIQQISQSIIEKRNKKSNFKKQKFK